MVLLAMVVDGQNKNVVSVSAVLICGRTFWLTFSIDRSVGVGTHVLNQDV